MRVEPEITSRFPDCVAMKLHLTAPAPVPKPSPLSRLVTTEVAAPPQTVDLSLTISFSGEQEVEVPAGRKLGLPDGRATFGIRRGQLRFEFGNCKLPLEKTALLKPFNVSMTVEQQQTRASEVQAGIKPSERSLSAKHTEGMAEKVTVDVFQVKKLGSEENPAWVFDAYGERNVLDGLLKETLLGALNIDCLPCTLTASFTARGEDIRITWGEVGLTKNIHRNKLAVIERAIVLHYLKPLLESQPLCQGRWCHD
ncbi:MAG: hypothetical protein O3C67_05525 [Cyanobacteria bacterium]|nr:hypothetical protein [Cyanobacteriota bacterium]